MKAFPSVSMKYDDLNGMDLRDYFAAKAMQGFMDKFARESDLNKLADDCYRYANAMMRAREK